MKTSKIKIFLEFLGVVIICLIAFLGIYVQQMNTMVNVVKDYKFGSELKKYREVVMELGSEVSDELKTVQNYEKAKSLIQARLDAFEVEDYNISLDKKTGKIYLQIEENDDTDQIITNVKETGTFVIKDSEDGTVLLDNSKIKTSRVMYNNQENGTVVFVEIEFNKEGKEILTEITGNTYATLPEEENNTTNETTSSEENVTENEENEDSTSNETTEETTEKEEEKVQKKVTLSMSGNDIQTTSFSNAMTEGKIDLTMNSATVDSKSIKGYAASANAIMIMLNNGPLPLEYSITENQSVTTDILKKNVKIGLLVVATVFAILLVYMVVKNKIRGLCSALSFVGFVALYSLLLRYTNVVISLEGIVAAIIVTAVNYVLSMKLLKVEKEKISDAQSDFLWKIMPVFILSIIFSFIKWTALSTFGMTAFWGIVLIMVYNLLITKNMVD